MILFLFLSAAIAVTATITYESNCYVPGQLENEEFLEIRTFLLHLDKLQHMLN